MTNYIETETKDGVTLLIEVSEDVKGAAGFGRPADSGNVTNEAAQEAYTQTLDTIRACANGVIDTLQDLEAQPSNASIEFGVKIDSKAGAMIAKSMNEGQFKISLSWKQPETESNND